MLNILFLLSCIHGVSLKYKYYHFIVYSNFYIRTHSSDLRVLQTMQPEFCPSTLTHT